MKEIKVIVVLVLSFLTICPLYAQNKKGKSKLSKTKKEAVIQQTDSIHVDTVAIKRVILPKHQTVLDTVVVRYFFGGHLAKDKLYMYANDDYGRLSSEQKMMVIKSLSALFPDRDITVLVSDKESELWVVTNNKLVFADRWKNDSLGMAEYLPIDVNEVGPSKRLYSVGGSFSGGKGYSSGSLNLRYGTYLYQQKHDASITSNFGYNKTDDTLQFAGDVGFDSRYYFKLSSLKYNISPYAGIGFSWVFAPVSYFELRLLAGTCYFVGRGSIDLCLQYGTKSGFSAIIGYTIRPKMGKEK